MARKNSKRLAIVGAGHMAEGTLATCNEVFEWEEVRVWSRTQATLDHFMQTQQPKFPQLKIHPSTDLEQVVRGADVVVTVTPARGPIVMDDWIAPGNRDGLAWPVPRKLAGADGPAGPPQPGQSAARAGPAQDRMGLPPAPVVGDGPMDPGARSGLHEVADVYRLW